jgi:hypothetical protein
MIIKEGKQEKKADHQHHHQMETVERGYEVVNEIELASKSKTTKSRLCWLLHCRSMPEHLV